jgi:oxygen-independent coproporphyrinogen-3 oxidase
VTAPASPGFGIYVHVPFCAARCDYCAFATYTDRDHLMSDYAEACVTEIERAVAEESLEPATSVFVGGGTPSRLPGALLRRILDAVPVAAGAEVTAECNPEDASSALFADWRGAGVTRVSFGVQSMVGHVLRGLGRAHRPAAVIRAVSLAGSAGFDSWNVDLIFGAAAETDADWAATLDRVLGWGVPHVSAYALTVEQGTPLASDPARHPDDDVQARRYLFADERLEAAGLANYEISNWARPGHECRHNLLYWAQGNYRGIGCAAHSHADGRRWWNVRLPERYIALVRAGRSVEAGSESLSDEVRRAERVQLALRTRAGLAAGAVAGEHLAGLEGFVEERDGRVVLTPNGRLVANEVAVRLDG